MWTDYILPRLPFGELNLAWAMVALAEQEMITRDGGSFRRHWKVKDGMHPAVRAIN
jgi:hypothetical protein